MSDLDEQQARQLFRVRCEGTPGPCFTMDIRYEVQRLTSGGWCPISDWGNEDDAYKSLDYHVAKYLKGDP